MLEQAQHRFTGDRDIFTALVQFSAQDGDRAAATRWAEQLRTLDAADAAPAATGP